MVRQRQPHAVREGVPVSLILAHGWVACVADTCGNTVDADRKLQQTAAYDLLLRYLLSTEGVPALKFTPRGTEYLWSVQPRASCWPQPELTDAYLVSMVGPSPFLQP